MRPLPRNLGKNGFRYTCVIRDGRSAIYLQEVTSNKVFYEVFLVQIKPEKVLFGKILPEREVYPRDEDFGYTAWLIEDLDAAITKLLEFNSNYYGK